ncbi:MAG: efflux RND transporter periplasmic adaptor subunit [Acidobacteriales bacterium]|nr:efflux RND transporter periplasmic adaptor subunit [Terriglobales bacterium]
MLMCILWLTACDRANQTAAASQEKAAQHKSDEVSLPVSEQTGSTFQVETLAASNEPELLRVPGRITLADNGSWRVGVLTSGRVEQVYVNSGDFVDKGQVLAGMHSHDVHEARAAYQTSRSDLSRAEAAAALAQKNYDRTQRLYSLKAASLEEVERARQELVNAQAAVRDEQIDVEKERVHLKDTLGIPPDPGVEYRGNDADLIPIRAPGAGYVLAKNVSAGTVVDPTKDVFVIGDLKRLWMIASVNETNIARLRAGQRANVNVNAFANEHFTGKVTNLGQELDPVTRVMRVRIELENPSIKLRPEMLATAEIAVGGSRPLLLLPSEAVQQINGQDVVFVRKSADRFEMRPVRTGETVGGRLAILEGVKAGDAVVIRGSFLLKSQLLKSSMESE